MICKNIVVKDFKFYFFKGNDFNNKFLKVCDFIISFSKFAILIVNVYKLMIESQNLEQICYSIIIVLQSIMLNYRITNLLEVLRFS